MPGDFEILRDVFGFHPLAVEDSESFGQRAKIEDYDDFVFIVLYGAVAGRGPARRGALFYSERFLVTVHHDDCPGVRRDPRALREARRARSSTRRSSSTGSSTASSTASSRSSRTSTTASTSSRTRSSRTPTTASCRRSSG